MSYLARLKQLEREKNSHYDTCTELTKPTEPPFGSFGGSPPKHIEKKLNDEAVLSDLIIECMKLVGELLVDWQSYVDAALADPDDALAFYTTLKHNLLFPQVEIEPTVKAADLIYTLQLGGFKFNLINDHLSIEPVEKLTIATKKLINKYEMRLLMK